MEILQKISILWVPACILALLLFLRCLLISQRLSSKFNLSFNASRFIFLVPTKTIMVAYFGIDDVHVKENILKMIAARRAFFICAAIAAFFYLLPKVVHSWLMG
jgi:hypothetical protein